jgi:sulfoxide reductase catalytic subunit YedY
MLIKRPKGWELPERTVTPEGLYRRRREVVAAMGLGAVALVAASAPKGARADDKPLARTNRYGMPEPVTAEKLATTYNNFYEFSDDKTLWRMAQTLKVRPWTIAVSGKVEKPFEIGIDELLAQMPLEERVYRHRCVETWSMIVPWSGFPLKALVDYCKPVGNPRYLVMKTAADAATMPGLQEVVYPWPYIEGLAIDEAMHDLAFIATGLYGKPIPRQNGAPLRLVTPWKYGFKSIKSIVSIEFSDTRPVSFWEKLQASEYGFWANVNPQVPHPRWSQASEKPLGSSERIATQLYNGYGEFVAGLYENRKSEKLFM